jgi:hypothetical protein
MVSIYKFDKKKFFFLKVISEYWKIWIENPKKSQNTFEKKFFFYKKINFRLLCRKFQEKPKKNM